MDHEQRRRDIAEAVWRLLEQGGLEAATVRAVVAETGLSSGSIRYFFADQASLHAFAMSALADRVGERIRRAARNPDPRERATDMVAELMPLREDTERELRVWSAFVARSATSPRLAEHLTSQAHAIRALLHKVTSDLVGLGLLPPRTDVDAHTAHLHAVVDGLTFQLLHTPELITPDQARAVLRRALLTDQK